MRTSPFILHVLVTVSVLIFLGGCGGTPPITPEPSARKRPPTQRPYTINGKTYYPIESADGYKEKGKASWYGKKFHGRKTANGETYDMYAKTAAHKTLPMGTILLVRNLDNGMETVVRVNDRGPFVRGRIIDLSYTAASEVNMVRSGVVRTEIIAMGEPAQPARKGGKAPTELKHPDFFKGNYYIQVGSFLNKDNAERLARLFLAAGTKAIIQPFITSGHKYYRVQVFAGTSLKLAKVMEQKLVGEGYTGAFVFAR